MKTIKANFTISPRILDHLGIAAYNSLKKCLAELCANCYDSDAKIVKILLPNAIDDNASIIIEDDGIGMSLNDLSKKYLSIGFNRRIYGEVINERQIIGSKGIGKLAGFGIAGRIKITTWQKEKQHTITLERSAFETLENLNDFPIIISTEETTKSHGTKIILSSLNKELSLPPIGDLKAHLFKALPQIADFKILVNDTEISAEDISGTRFEINLELNGNKISGYYKIANKRQNNAGLSVRVKKRRVTDPDLFGLEKRSHFSFISERIIGDVNADFLDPYINTSRDGFLEDAEIVRSFRDKIHDFLSEIVRGEENKAEDTRIRTLFEKPDIKTKISKLPPHIRGTAKKVISAIVVKLKSVEDKETEELIDWIIKYYESNVLKELMHAIVSADLNDVEKLSILIESWGLKQLTSISELIKSQIDIIDKLSEVVASDKAKEMELHKLIENNLWLIREGLEIWSSDKTLKTLLEKSINITYKDKLHLRPDLVCKSRSDSNAAVILEFKKPSEKIVMDHVTQALKYEGLIRANLPNLNIEVYVVGREYESDVLATKNKLEKANLSFLSLDEILQRARIRFEKILEILDR